MARLVLLLSLLLGSTYAVCKTGSLTAAEQAALDKHNALRALHEDTSDLCYGESGSDVTFTAQSWADSMAANKAMEHSSGSYGENLAMAGTSGTVAAKIPAYESSTQAWYNEIDDWNFDDSKSTGGVTGHFTQVCRWVGFGVVTMATRKFGSVRFGVS